MSAPLWILAKPLDCPKHPRLAKNNIGFAQRSKAVLTHRTPKGIDMSDNRSWIIGAAAGCQIVVEAPTVSSRHCRLTQSGSGLVLEDLNSTNGTFVNDQRVADAARVSRGDRISLGRDIDLDVGFLLDHLGSPAAVSSTRWDIRQLGLTPILAASVLLTVALLGVAVAKFSGPSADNSASEDVSTESHVPVNHSPAHTTSFVQKPVQIVSNKSKTKRSESTTNAPSDPLVEILPPAQPMTSFKAVAVDPRQAVYVVLAHPADGGTARQIGTAWAASPRQLVTCGSIARDVLKRDHAQFPTVTVRCEALGSVATVTESKLHPEYERLDPGFQQTVRALFESGKQLDDLKREGHPVSAALEQEFAASIAKVNQTYAERAFFDLGVLAVDQDLPVCLPVATANDKIETPLSALGGVPGHGSADPGQSIIPAGRLRCLMGTKVSRNDGSLMRWQWPTETSHQGRNWTGSPVLDAAGRVVGLFSLPTPPSDPQGQDQPATNQFDAVSIQQLDHMLPEVFRVPFKSK